MLKWFIILFVVVCICFLCSNVEFSLFEDFSRGVIKQEKTMKKFFESDRQNKEEMQKVIQDY